MCQMDIVNALTYLLVCLFGSSTWLSINAIWVELSLYTSKLPEGWSLPSYLAAIIQIACIGPLLYSVLHKCTRLTINKPTLILTLLTISTVCMLLLALFWQSTIWMFGSKRSVAIIALTFVMALVSATSNVLFLPYMATFHANFLTAFFVGMSFSSLVPSMLKLVQGVGTYECVPSVHPNGTSTIKPVQVEPLFQIQHYNLAMFGWMSAATIAFAILHWHSGDGRAERQRKEQTPADRRQGKGQDQQETEDEQRPLKPKSAEETGEFGHTNRADGGADMEPIGSGGARTRYCIQIACLALICAEMNTIVPSVHSYATLAYSLLTYHLALTLSNLSHPLANFFPLWVKPRSLLALLSLTAICSAGTVFIVVLALQSPHPLLRDSVPALGSTLAIGVSIITGFLCSYLRTHITSLVRAEHSDSESSLFWCGVFMQVGSFLGACVMFPLVNVFKLFQKRDPCS